MKKLLLALLLSAVAGPAWAQCNGAFPNNTLCGNFSGSTAVPKATASSLLPAAGPTGAVQFNNGGVFGGDSGLVYTSGTGNLNLGIPGATATGIDIAGINSGGTAGPQIIIEGSRINGAFGFGPGSVATSGYPHVDFYFGQTQSPLGGPWDFSTASDHVANFAIFNGSLKLGTGGTIIGELKTPAAGQLQFNVGGTLRLDYSVTNNGAWEFSAPTDFNLGTAFIDSNNVYLWNHGIYGWSSTGNAHDATIDTGLSRFGAGIAGLSNTTNASSWQVYRTTDSTNSPTNFERGVLDWTTTTNVLTIGTQKGGTGQTRNIQFVVGGANAFDIDINQANTLTIALASGVVSPYFNASTVSGGISGLFVRLNTDSPSGAAGNRLVANLDASDNPRVAMGPGGSSAQDIAIARNAAGVLEVNSATAGTFREAKLRSLVIGGTSPTTTGSTCTTGTQTGGNTAGTVVVTCTAQSLVLNFGFTAPTGWACDAEDRTTVADLIRQTASTTTSATFGSNTTAASDVVQFKCMAY